VLEDKEMSDQHYRKSADPLLLERLAEIGFLASECGLHDEAEKIFRWMAKVKPGNPSSLIALAMVRARRGSTEQAIEALKHVIADHAESEMAKAVLGMILVQCKQPGALPLFEEVLASAQDHGAVNIANCCIDLAREQKSNAEPAATESLEFFRHYNVVRA
jgi:predicted Zn-dependent protease